MVLNEEKHYLNGKEIIFRSAKEEEADMLIGYLKTVTGETRFLMCESDEVKYTTESEIEFIKEHNESEKGLIMLAFVDGEHAGNCSFLTVGSSRRNKHRASLGIALYQKYTELASEYKDILFGGRLGQYKYYNMDQVVRAALDMARSV